MDFALVSEANHRVTKHARPTGIPVAISIYCGCNANRRVVVEVRDDGVGFPEGFDPMKGGGVGLRLIRQLVASLHADLEITSDSLGASFRLVLPQAKAAS
jgi:two-component sensor histidine kinase